MSLGMEDGQIKDDQIDASSEWDKKYTGASSARLNKPSQGRVSTTRAWSPQEDDQEQWIGVNLGDATTMVGLLTQGREGPEAWVTEYCVSYRTKANEEYQFLTDARGSLQVRDLHSKTLIPSVTY